MPSRVSSPRFVGRAAELATLDAAVARTAAGQSAAVLLAGDAGIGKSRLVAEFERRAQDAGAEVLVGECVELTEGELPYGPIVAALRPLIGPADDGPIAALHPAVRGALARLWPELADSGGVEQDEFARGQLFEAVHRVLAVLAAERPVVLIIEDLHWADRSTRDLLAFLIRNAPHERVLFVASYRTDEVNRRHPLHQFISELERSGRAERLTVPAFDLFERREQLTGILGEEPDPRLARRLHERSEGNPFFAEELLAAADAGMLPDSLLDALLARVERLTDPARRSPSSASPTLPRRRASPTPSGSSRSQPALRTAPGRNDLRPIRDPRRVVRS
ncbi:MAG TPA: AAA family ATPase [Solirubrobacteraceae bacterium]|nr:AAA family ATPase [Solirubrobacteraceae bacterium]